MRLLRLLNNRNTIVMLVALMAASISPLAFTLSATGRYTFHWLGIYAILPAIIIWLTILAYSVISSNKQLTNIMMLSIGAGVLGTIAMEIVRSIGFSYFHAMPGSLPMLMGVKLTNQFMVGPDGWSNLIGWSDHFWNGIGFTFIYLVLFGNGKWWLATLYSMSVATIFMVSPVMNVLGVGDFGQEFAPIAFPLTVYLAHIAWGTTFGFIAQKSKHNIESLYEKERQLWIEMN